MEKNQVKEKLLRLLMEAQLIMQNELTPNEVAKTIRHYDLTYLQNMIYSIKR